MAREQKMSEARSITAATRLFATVGDPNRAGALTAGVRTGVRAAAIRVAAPQRTPNSLKNC
jgi:hypothetical protein